MQLHSPCWILRVEPRAELKYTNVAENCVIYVLDNEIFLTYNTGIFKIIQIQLLLFFLDVINIVSN